MYDMSEKFVLTLFHLIQELLCHPGLPQRASDVEATNILDNFHRPFDSMPIGVDLMCDPRPFTSPNAPIVRDDGHKQITPFFFAILSINWLGPITR
jgi:hypothetical protein